jgi:hypothetical protein
MVIGPAFGGVLAVCVSIGTVSTFCLSGPLLHAVPPTMRAAAATAPMCLSIMNDLPTGLCKLAAVFGVTAVPR